MKHTPGPWLVDSKQHVYAEAEYKPQPFTDKDGVLHPDHMGGLLALPYGTDTGTQEANARLIAASPKLLDVTRELHDAAVDAQNFLHGANPPISKEDIIINLVNACANARMVMREANGEAQQ